MLRQRRLQRRRRQPHQGNGSPSTRSAVGVTVEYARLASLVRPGAQGATLEALGIAAECVGLEPGLVNPRAIGRLGAPILGHFAPRHFVVVAPLRDGRVAVLDPARAIVRADWEHVREALSPLAWTMTDGGRT